MIDRREWVTRHDPVLNAPDPASPLTVGNGSMAFNVDVTGLQTLYEEYAAETPLCTMAELEYRVRPCGDIGAYLCDQLDEHANEPGPRTSDFRSGETWVLGDNPTIGLLLYEHRFEFDWVQAPTVLKDGGGYVTDVRNRPIRVYRKIDSRLILEDMYAKLALFHQRHGNKHQA